MKDSNVIKSMLTAIRPVVVGLLLWTAYDMALIVYGLTNGTAAQIFSQSWDKMLITLVTFVILVFTKANPVFIIMVSRCIRIFHLPIGEEYERDNKDRYSDGRVGHQTSSAYLVKTKTSGSSRRKNSFGSYYG